MTATTCASQACDRPVHDTTICSQCEAKLLAALRAVPGVQDELDITLARQGRGSGSGAGYVTGTSTPPLPYDDRAAEAARDLRQTLHAWAMLVADERGVHPARRPHDSSVRLAAWLTRNLGWLRTHPAAADAVDEIDTTVRRASRAGHVDRPHRTYLGVCTSALPDGGGFCAQQLMADEGATSVRCPGCGTVHVVTDRQDVMRAAMEDVLLTASEIGQYVVVFGQAVSRQRIGNWVLRGRLAAHGHTPDGRPLYRVGAVLDVLADDARRADSPTRRRKRGTSAA